MGTERERTLEGLQAAIQMEVDGKAFYLKTSRESTNEAGRNLLSSLATEEDFHRRTFEQIYDAIREREAWPDVDPHAERAPALQTVFAGETKRRDASAAPATELDAVRTGMTMENKTYDFYTARSRDAEYAAEREFYTAIAAQERVHHTLLMELYEFLKDPAQYYTGKEHPSLDAG